MVGDKVKAFFLSMIDVMGKQVLKSPLVVKGADYMEMARYCSSKRHMCGRVAISLREAAENILRGGALVFRGGMLQFHLF